MYSKKLSCGLIIYFIIVTQSLLGQAIIVSSYDVSGNRLAKKTQGSSPNPTVVANPSSVSLSQASTLTASGCPGTVKWSNGQQGALISVTPTVTTPYTASCVTTNCPTNSIGQVTVEVYKCQPDAIGVTSTLSSVRYGQAVTLTAYGCPGMVVWSNGQTGFTTTSQIYGSPDTFTAYCSKRNCPNSGAGTISVMGVSECAAGNVMVTVKQGDWNDPTVWLCNRLPASNEEVLIRHVITVDGAVNGAKEAKSVVLNGGYIVSLNNGSVDIKSY